MIYLYFIFYITNTSCYNRVYTLFISTVGYIGREKLIVICSEDNNTNHNLVCKCYSDIKLVEKYKDLMSVQ